MQERFCTCGYKVLVNYGLTSPASWNPVFVSANSAISVIRTCPCCGKALDIDSLR